MEIVSEGDRPCECTPVEGARRGTVSPCMPAVMWMSCECHVDVMWMLHGCHVNVM